MAAPDFEQFQAMMRQLMNPNDAMRNEAEAAFKGLQTQPDMWATFLIQAIRTSADPIVRELSCVLFRSESFDVDNDEKSMWLRLSPQIRQSIKGEMLQAMEQEQER